MESDKACEGAPTIQHYGRMSGADSVACIHCGREVRWDLADDSFWGFQNCQEKDKGDEANQNRIRQIQR